MAPKKMRFSADFFKSALENIQDGVYVVDPARRIIFWNSGAERMTGYAARQVTGTFCFDDKLRHVDDKGQLLCKEECPLSKTLADGLFRESDIYLHHRDGQRIPVHVKIAPIRDARGKITNAVEIFTENRDQKEIQERLAELEKMALNDALTGIPNRRFLDDRLDIRLAERERYGWPVGVAILDLDNFKKINDTHGHDTGDRVLKMVALTLLNNMRPFDDVGRWGGEEFLVLAENIEGDDLFSLIERLRILVAASSLDLNSGSLAVTVSAGVSEVRSGDSRESVLKRADEALYSSKKAGKNRVTVS